MTECPIAKQFAIIQNSNHKMQIASIRSGNCIQNSWTVHDMYQVAGGLSLEGTPAKLKSQEDVKLDTQTSNSSLSVKSYITHQHFVT